ncbi:MAG: hypothetical protein WAM11_13550 [Cyanobium sp.]
MLISKGVPIPFALLALSGALVTMYKGFADVSMGIGLLILGLDLEIIGESALRPGSVRKALLAVVVGVILFRLLIAIALQLGLDPVDLKLNSSWPMWWSNKPQGPLNPDWIEIGLVSASFAFGQSPIDRSGSSRSNPDQLNPDQSSIAGTSLRRSFNCIAID